MLAMRVYTIIMYSNSNSSFTMYNTNYALNQMIIQTGAAELVGLVKFWWDHFLVIK